jgi:hypothetical protein
MIKDRPVTEARVLQTLHAYLTANEYRCFLGWSSLPSINACPLEHNSSHVLTTTRDVHRPLRAGYRHAYELDRLRIPVRPLRFYRTRKGER